MSPPPTLAGWQVSLKNALRGLRKDKVPLQQGEYRHPRQRHTVRRSFNRKVAQIRRNTVAKGASKLCGVAREKLVEEARTVWTSPPKEKHFQAPQLCVMSNWTSFRTRSQSARSTT